MEKKTSQGQYTLLNLYKFLFGPEWAKVTGVVDCADVYKELIKKVFLMPNHTKDERPNLYSQHVDRAVIEKEAYILGRENTRVMQCTPEQWREDVQWKEANIHSLKMQKAQRQKEKAALKHSNEELCKDNDKS